jgi:nitrite transporter NirC
MTVLGLALAGNHPETVSLGGAAWNLLWVTLGNAVGGGVFVAGAYWVATHGFPGKTGADEAAPASGTLK